MRGWIAGAFVGALVLVFAAAAASSASTLSPPTPRWRATVAKLPANAATGKKRWVVITSISCASPGNCSAVGAYADSAGRDHGLLLTETAGHWRKGAEAGLPADADSDPAVYMASVSCASAGNCTAVGTYTDSSPGIYGEGGLSVVLLTEKRGHWRRGVEAALPADAGGATISLESLSCYSAGNCTAVGRYSSSYTYGYEGLLLTEKAGHWAPGVSYGRWADINSVSCSPDGHCAAVGYENADFVCRDGCPSADSLWLTNYRGGEWQAATDVPPDILFGGVSCVSAGNCSAFGVNYFNSGIDEEGFPVGVFVTERAGKWRDVAAAPPKNADSPVWGNEVDLGGISCASGGDCGAFGTYWGRKNARHMTVLNEHAGKWRQGVEAALPRGARAPEGAAISCASPGNCTVVGSYVNRAGGHGLLLTETAGTWARGVKAPGRSRYLSEVSCPTADSCTAVGADARGDVILLDR